MKNVINEREHRSSLLWPATLLLLLALLIWMPSGQARAAVTVSNTVQTANGGTWKKKRVNGTAKYRYKTVDGKYLKNGWKKIDGEWYCIDRKGYVLTGLKKVNKKYYLFDKTGRKGKAGIMKTGAQKVGKKQYFFRTTGSAGVLGSRVESDWAEVDGELRYFCQDGNLHPRKYLTEEEFIKLVGPLAQADMKNTGILASVTIAQAILESGYGSSSLAMEANNFFGMKASLSGNTWSSDWGGKTFTKQTLEDYGNGLVTITADFRAYDDIADSIRDHSNYLRYAKNGSALRYEGVVGNKSYRQTIRIIKNGGYATDREYVSKIVNIIKRFKLTKYDK